MVKDLQVEATVQRGGKIELVCPELEEGQEVRVWVRTLPPREKRRSAVDILAEAPGHRLFKTAEEVKEYLAEEKASWDR